MTILNPLGNLRSRASGPTVGPQSVLAGALAAAVTVAAVFHPTTPQDALLPSLSILFLLLAAAVALIAWHVPIPNRQFSYWDAAGVLTLIGILISFAVEPEQMVRLVAGTEQSP